MSAERSQKTFDATPARKQQARREGNVARSTELSGIAAFACATLATIAVLPALGASAADVLVVASAHPDLARIPSSLVAVCALALIPVAAAATGAVGAGLAQAGGMHVKFPQLQLARLNPVAGLKRMFGAEALIGALRALVAFGVAVLALWPLANETLARASTVHAPVALGLLVETGAQRACFATIAVGVCFAVADYALARRRWLRDLKMSLEEIRRDHKENDGDPQARSRRKALHRSLVRGSIARTKDASFVVVNPTHIAIAVRYEPPDVPVPEILVRAADEAAHSVKALAVMHGIPIVENIALARALFAHGEAGEAIPSSTFVAVAQTIAELIRAGAM